MCFRSILVFLKQCLGMITHSMTIFVFLKKIDFLKFKNWLKKIENWRFYEESVSESKDCFARRNFIIVPQTHLESTSPPLLPTCIPDFDFFCFFFKKFYFWTIFDMKSNFHFYFMGLFFSKSMDQSELFNALSNVI